MEKFKKIEEIKNYDIRFNAFVGDNYYDETLSTGLSLEYVYNIVKDINLNDNVPDEIKSQFNIAKNLYVYSWFSYPFKTVADLKSISTLEYSLRIIYNNKKLGLKKLLEKAIDDKKIVYLESKDENILSKQQKLRAKLLYTVRNDLAHGSLSLDLPTNNKIFVICANCINQLYFVRKN